MAMSAMVISIVLTVGILVLALITISKGYGYKHTVDPAVSEKVKEEKSELEQKDNHDV